MTWSYILNIDRGPYSHVGRMVMVMVISLIDCVSIFFLDALGAGKRPVFFSLWGMHVLPTFGSMSQRFNQQQ